MIMQSNAYHLVKGVVRLSVSTRTLSHHLQQLPDVPVNCGLLV